MPPKTFACYANTLPVTTPSPLRALYAHVPFCHTICGYCDFYSEVLDPRAAGPLSDALLAELNRYAADLPLALDTIFVGGGTPTTLPSELLERLVRGLSAHAATDTSVEFTVEANPATVDDRVAETLIAGGVNRVSIGAQSFDPGELRVLERIHDPPQVAKTVETCRRHGIGQVNLDLIFAVPGQSLAAWLRNLDRALELQPDHLSCYGLTYERGTPLWNQLQAGRVQRVDDGLEAEMYEATVQRLTAAGFVQYEISNFARPGSECRHNLRYWRGDRYLGIGPSAAGYIGDVRYKNVPDTAAYARSIHAGRSAWIEHERLSPDVQAREAVMLELRLPAGLDRGRFAERFGLDPLRAFPDAVGRNVEAGLLDVTDRYLRLTRRGMLLADAVITDFL